MAIVTDVFVKGTLENLVFYYRMGRRCSRMKRESIQQTEAMQIRGINFGIAARAGKGLRNGLEKFMPSPTDRSMQSRLSGAIAKWLSLQNANDLPTYEDAPYIGNFQFTKGTGFTERFRIPFTVSQPQSDRITVTIDAFIPTQNIKAPAGTVSVKLTITVAGCILISGEPGGHATHTLNIPYNDVEIPAQSINFAIPVLPGSLTVTAAKLQYYAGNSGNSIETTEPAWMPASMVNARYS
jgi:hypothetical protein